MNGINFPSSSLLNSDNYELYLSVSASVLLVNAINVLGKSLLVIILHGWFEAGIFMSTFFFHRSSYVLCTISAKIMTKKVQIAERFFFGNGSILLEMLFHVGNGLSFSLFVEVLFYQVLFRK